MQITLDQYSVALSSEEKETLEASIDLIQDIYDRMVDRYREGDPLGQAVTLALENLQIVKNGISDYDILNPSSLVDLSTAGILDTTKAEIEQLQTLLSSLKNYNIPNEPYTHLLKQYWEGNCSVTIGDEITEQYSFKAYILKNSDEYRLKCVNPFSTSTNDGIINQKISWNTSTSKWQYETEIIEGESIIAPIPIPEEADEATAQEINSQNEEILDALNTAWGNTSPSVATWSSFDYIYDDLYDQVIGSIDTLLDNLTPIATEPVIEPTEITVALALKDNAGIYQTAPNIDIILSGSRNDVSLGTIQATIALEDYVPPSTPNPNEIVPDYAAEQVIEINAFDVEVGDVLTLEFVDDNLNFEGETSITIEDGPIRIPDSGYITITIEPDEEEDDQYDSSEISLTYIDDLHNILNSRPENAAVSIGRWVEITETINNESVTTNTIEPVDNPVWFTLVQKNQNTYVASLNLTDIEKRDDHYPLVFRKNDGTVIDHYSIVETSDALTYNAEVDWGDSNVISLKYDGMITYTQNGDYYTKGKDTESTPDEDAVLLINGIAWPVAINSVNWEMTNLPRNWEGESVTYQIITDYEVEMGTETDSVIPFTIENYIGGSN